MKQDQINQDFYIGAGINVRSTLARKIAWILCFNSHVDLSCNFEVTENDQEIKISWSISFWDGLNSPLLLTQREETGTFSDDDWGHYLRLLFENRLAHQFVSVYKECVGILNSL